jgi:hypothetical protein
MVICQKSTKQKKSSPDTKKYLLKEAHHTSPRESDAAVCAQVVKSLTLLECEFAPKS